MPLVHIVLLLALLQFLFFGIAVGRARGKYQCPAPATTGNEMFERYFRVQMNTLEQLVMFVPALVIYAHLVDARWAAGLGAVYLVGRVIYFVTYVRDPKTRGLGFGLSMLPTMGLLIGALWAAIRAAVHGL
jgi:glutathione S-transferase